MKRRPSLPLLAPWALLLAGCATVREPVPPATPPAAAIPSTIDTPSARAGQPGTLPAAGPLGWEALIIEPRLKSMVALALQNNRDVLAAAADIEAARARHRITEASRLPTVRAGATRTRARGSDDLSGGHAPMTRQLSATLGIASWEIDLWGRLASLRDAALANFLASEETARGVQASLVAQVGTAWLQLQADQQLADLATRTLALREQALSLQQRRHTAGAASGLDVATAQAAVQTARLEQAATAAAIEQDVNALRLLLGMEPPAELLPLAPAPQALAVAQPLQRSGLAGQVAPPVLPPAPAPASQLVDVPAALSSRVLLRRPDVRIAEQQLLAASANLDAARAARLPTIALTAQAGLASTSLRNLLDGGAGIWSLAPSITLPIFDGGAIQSRIDETRALREATLARYDKALQTALRETADALAVRARLAERLAAQQGIVDAQARTLELTLYRRAAGSESPLASLDAQRQLHVAQQQLVALRLAEQVNRLTLFKVLGGT